MPWSVQAAGINSAGQVGGIIYGTYEGGLRQVAACLFSPSGIYTAISPFGFTMQARPVEAVTEAGLITFGARPPGGSGMRVVVVDTVSGNTTVLPDVGFSLQEITPVIMRGGTVYAIGSAVPPQNKAWAILYENGHPRQLQITGYESATFNYASVTGRYSALNLNTPTIPSRRVGLIYSNGVQAYPDVFLTSVNDHGVGTGANKISMPVYVENGIVREITIQADLAVPVDFASASRINNNGLVVGIYGRGRDFGVFGLWRNKAYDISAFAVMQAANFDQVFVEGLNDSDQIAITGRIRGQNVTRAYRIDVDLYS